MPFQNTATYQKPSKGFDQSVLVPRGGYDFVGTSEGLKYLQDVVAVQNSVKFCIIKQELYLFLLEQPKKFSLFGRRKKG